MFPGPEGGTKGSLRIPGTHHVGAWTSSAFNRARGRTKPGKKPAQGEGLRRGPGAPEPGRNPGHGRGTTGRGPGNTPGRRRPENNVNTACRERGQIRRAAITGRAGGGGHVDDQRQSTAGRPGRGNWETIGADRPRCNARLSGYRAEPREESAGRAAPATLRLEAATTLRMGRDKYPRKRNEWDWPMRISQSIFPHFHLKSPERKKKSPLHHSRAQTKKRSTPGKAAQKFRPAPSFQKARPPLNRTRQGGVQTRTGHDPMFPSPPKGKGQIEKVRKPFTLWVTSPR